MSRFWRSRPGRIGLVTLLAFVALALAAPIIASRTGLDTSLARANDVPLYASPAEFAPLGTDHLRRSVWTQFVWGSRISLFVGLAATVVTVALGSLVGIVAGFAGGRVEAALMRLTEWFLVVPFLPLAIVLASILGRSIWNIIFVIGVTSWPSTARLVRAQVLTVKQRLFVDRARSLGASGPHIVRHHILPNVSGLIMANATLAVPISILTESTLAFLGLGDVRRPSWGKMLSEAFDASALTRNAWWYFVPPGVGILVVVLAFTLIGQTLEEMADPRLQGRR
ncbi:MAG: ABC transporter permease [Acidimicrobiia bacterium]|nr:ABC transporter permease [Acidimicrobiia bacterium]